jgi:hypothetical protein
LDLCRVAGVGAKGIRIPEFFFGFDPPPPRATNQPGCPLRLARSSGDHTRREPRSKTAERGCNGKKWWCTHTRHPVGSRPRSVGMFAIVSVVLDPLKKSAVRLAGGGCPSSWGDSPCLSRLGLRWLSVLPHSPGEPSSGPLGGRPIPSPPLTSLATPRSGIKLVTVPSSTFFVPSVEPDTSSQLFPPQLVRCRPNSAAN